MPTVRGGRHTTKRKTKLLKYLPRGAFQNPIFSPGRDKQQRSGFSGPIVSMIPDEARRRPRKGSSRADGEDDDVYRLGPTQEPSSPKVSCIGQIKLRKDKKKKKKKTKVIKKADEKDQEHKAKEQAKAKKQDSKILKMFGFRGSNPKADKPRHVQSEKAPSLGNMRRFSSGRQSLANFDWTAQIAPVSDLDDRNCHSDEEFGSYSDEDEEVIIPFSAPMVVGMTEPRREVNLWQRRNTVSPPPLQLKPIKIRGD